MALTRDVFARVNGKLARWDLGEHVDHVDAIAHVIAIENPPQPVLALVIGGPAKEIEHVDQS